MNFKQGIIMVAFGKNYENMAAHCLVYSRKISDIPVYVLTNIKGPNRNEKWKECCNVEFKEFDLPDDQNRDVKTSCINYTPFEKTLYLDCDSIIQNPGIEEVFDRIVPNKLFACFYGHFHEGPTKEHYHYHIATQNIPVTFPLEVYYGAFFGFYKTKVMVDFFRLWNKYWKMNTGREMPSLAIAIQKSKIDLTPINKNNDIFAFKINANAIIQHEHHRNIRILVGCPEFKAWKPFDIGRKI